MLPKVVLDRLVTVEISFQTVAEGVYKKLDRPKRRVWPKFPQTLGPLSIPTLTWATKFSDHIVSLKLGFSSKRKHDPKSWVDSYLRKNHFKAGYTHEEEPDESIYQGFNTFFEFLARSKSKEEQNQILCYQKEIRDMVRAYRAMEWDIQEKMRKDKEEEAQEAKYSSVTTSSDMDKGKRPVEDICSAGQNLDTYCSIV